MNSNSNDTSSIHYNEMEGVIMCSRLIVNNHTPQKKKQPKMITDATELEINKKSCENNAQV